jgi:hypothetical protein
MKYFNNIFLLISIFVVFYINKQIELFNPYFFKGKDGGFMFKIYFHIFFTIVYTISYNRKVKLLLYVFSFFVAIISFLLSYFLINKFTNLDIVFHNILAILLIVFFNFLFNKTSN